MTNELYDSSHVARHCSAMRIKTNGTPLPAAFQLRKNEQFLSVNWIEYFGRANTADNMVKVGEEVCKHRDISGKSGCFAVINVGGAKRTIAEKHNKVLLFKDLQESNHPSHAGVYGYTASDLGVAHTLSEMVGRNNMYPGTYCGPQK